MKDEEFEVYDKNKEWLFRDTFENCSEILERVKNGKTFFKYTKEWGIRRSTRILPSK